MIRQPRTSQPQGPVGIDWGNPLARGLVDAVPASQLRTVVNQVAATVSGSMTPSVGLLGTARRSATSGANKDIYDGAWSRLPAPLTLLTVYKLNSLDFSTRVSGNLTVSTNGYGLAPSITNYRAIVSRSGVNTVLTGSATSTSKTKIDVLVVDPTNATFWENGVRTVSPTAHGGMATATGAFTHGAENAASNTNNADYYLSLVWNRALSDAEIKSLSDNPWQIFQPVNRAIWNGFDSPAGGSPYTLTAEAGAVAIAGTATGLAFNRTLVADAGSAGIVGADAGLAFNRKLIADTANVPLAGADATLAFNRKLTADTTNLAITGNDATLTFTPVGGPTHTLTADTAGVALTGTTTGLAFNRKLIAETTNTAIGGTAIGLARGYAFAVSTASLGVSASDAALIAVRRMVAEAYALVVAANDATLTYSGAEVPPPQGAMVGNRPKANSIRMVSGSTSRPGRIASTTR